jgi:peptidoglycan/LPS O-acetylase OafA/YrhL
VLLIAALATTRLADKGLVARSCMLLGWASYSLYILQSPLWRLYWLAQGKDAGVVYSVKQVLPFVALLIGVSVAVYWFFERPTEKWIKGHFGGGPRRKPEAPRFQLPFPFPKRSTLPRG